MADRIFYHADEDGDTLTASPLGEEYGSDKVRVRIGEGGVHERTVHLTAEAVTSLRAALAAYDPAATAEATPRAGMFGDRAVVTGDTATWNHGFDAGTVVVLDRQTDNYFGRRGGVGGWKCTGPGGAVWNVHTDDLTPADRPAQPADVDLDDEPLLDPERVAALKKARELAPRGPFGTSHDGILAFARFLLDVEELDL